MKTDKANTPDEIVDVVNEKDEVIGTSTKGEVNSNPALIHREIGVIIYNDDGKVLIQRRSRYKKSNPLTWTVSVAGHVSKGETYEEAAHKELKEELGFDIKIKPYEKVLIKLPTETQMATCYIGKFISGIKVIINPDEIEEYRFVNESELEELNTSQKVEAASLEDLRKFFKGDFDKFK